METITHMKKTTGQIRIIGGLYKRTPLAVNHSPGLRPTPSRVRETLFNWLGQDLSGWHCVDAFAGSGALGFEAASRSAHQVLLCEQDAALVAQLQAVKTKLQASRVSIERGDGLACLGRLAPGSVQLIFLDPPFESALYEPALRACSQALSDSGYVYLESARAWSDEELTRFGLQIHRRAQAGAVHFCLLSVVPA